MRTFVEFTRSGSREERWARDTPSGGGVDEKERKLANELSQHAHTHTRTKAEGTAPDVRCAASDQSIDSVGIDRSAQRRRSSDSHSTQRLRRGIDRRDVDPKRELAVRPESGRRLCAMTSSVSDDHVRPPPHASPTALLLLSRAKPHATPNRSTTAGAAFAHPLVNAVAAVARVGQAGATGGHRQMSFRG
ncbi:hypothetical protein V3C99_000232 [Haemonchus contortus]